MISFPGGAEENKGIDVLGGIYDGMCDSGRAVSHIPHGARVLKAEYDLGDGVCRTIFDLFLQTFTVHPRTPFTVHPRTHFPP